MSEKNYIRENSATDTVDLVTSFVASLDYQDWEDDKGSRLTTNDIVEEIRFVLSRIGDNINAPLSSTVANITPQIGYRDIVLGVFWTYCYSVQRAWRSWFSNDCKSSSQYPVTISKNDFISKEKVEIYTDNLINVKDDVFQHCNKLKILRIPKSNVGSNAGLATLPSSISCLTSLEILDVSENTLSYIPSKLWELKCLQQLFLNNCGIEKLSTGLKDMESLRIFYLNNNRLSFFEFSELPPNLVQLSLSHNAIRNVNGMLTQKIESFDISHNFIEELPINIFDSATTLSACHLGNNKLKSIPPSFVNLTSIIRIIVCKNQFKSLPFDFGKLRTLRVLDISGNEITQLPESIVELRLREWNCEDNPLRNPPLEVALKGPRSMKIYFDSLKITNEIRSKRLKIMVLGDENAGKKLVFAPCI